MTKRANKKPQTFNRNAHFRGLLSVASSLELPHPLPEQHKTDLVFITKRIIAFVTTEG